MVNIDATENAATKIILVIEDFYVQRDGVGLAAYMARYHRHGAEFAMARALHRSTP